MNNALTILKLYLTTLGVPPDINTIDDRKRVQKAVYLAQAAGANLHYRYNWYVRGPYSPDLAKDYYKLSEAILLDDISSAGNKTANEENAPPLKDWIRQKLQSLDSIIETPAGVNLPQADWLELASSLHYLQTVDKDDLDKAREVIEREKPHLKDYVDVAQAKLKKLKLLP